MTDGLGRTIDYLRISVTDKCNLRCQYCMPKEGIARLKHEEVLSLEEIYRVAAMAEALGVTRVRITGGEPLVRKNVVKLIRDIHSLKGIREIAVTTNGILFASMAEELKEAGVTSVNISLDTTNRETYRLITGVDGYDRVMEALDKALEMGMQTKINSVLYRECNHEEAALLAEIAKERKVDVRFIELMPVGCGRLFQGVPSDVILAQLEQVYGKAQPCEEKRGGGPAGYYSLEGFQGKIGFISPLSHKFCGGCNRIRLTAEGRLKLCLHYDRGLELRPLLRSGMADEEIQDKMERAIWEKPASHQFEDSGFVDWEDTRKMVQIGG